MISIYSDFISVDTKITNQNIILKCCFEFKVPKIKPYRIEKVYCYNGKPYSIVCPIFQRKSKISIIMTYHVFDWYKVNVIS